jgi:hypothetical protein
MMKERAVPWVKPDDVKRIAKLLPRKNNNLTNRAVNSINLVQFAHSLNTIKRGLAFSNLETDHLNSSDLWKLIQATTIELKKLINKAQVNSQPAEFALGDLPNVGLKRHLDLLEKIAYLRVEFFDGITKGHRHGRSPSNEFVWRSFLKLWMDHGGKPSKTKEGPFYRFLSEGCSIIGAQCPKSDSVPAIVERSLVSLNLLHAIKGDLNSRKTF